MTTPARRRDPVPISRGGELALLIFGGALLLAALAALAGLAAAAAATGGGWVWPHGIDTAAHTLAGLLTGRPGRGLPPELRARVPGPGAVYPAVGIGELLLAGLLTAAAILWTRHRRPGDARAGMASRAEARAALGAGRLRQARQIIRPDLYPGGRR